jgi:hypothetical protein
LVVEDGFCPWRGIISGRGHEAADKMKWTGLTGFLRIYRIKDF